MNKKNSFKKILFVVSAKSSYRTPIINVLKKKNIKVITFDNRKTTVIEKTIFTCSKLFPRLYAMATKLINKRLLKLAGSWQPDMVLVSKGENVNARTISLLSQKAITINWFSDYFSKFKEIENWLKAYDYFFTGDNYDVVKYKEKGYKNLYYLPYSAQKLPPYKGKRIYDVTFIGSYTKDREKLFLSLRKFNLRVWGDKRWLKGQLKNNSIGHWTNYDEMINIMKKSKIVINHHRESGKLNTVLNMRVYEACATGALLITDERRDTAKMFTINEELVTYKTANDLYQKVKYFLEHENERKKIAAAGYSRLLREHTYEKRLNQIFRLVKQKS